MLKVQPGSPIESDGIVIVLCAQKANHHIRAIPTFRPEGDGIRGRGARNGRNDLLFPIGSRSDIEYYRATDAHRSQ